MDAKPDTVLVTSVLIIPTCLLHHSFHGCSLMAAPTKFWMLMRCFHQNERIHVFLKLLTNPLTALKNNEL